MMTPIVTEIRRNGNPVGERVELGRYRVPEGERIIYGQRVDGVVRVTDVPPTGADARTWSSASSSRTATPPSSPSSPTTSTRPSSTLRCP